MKRKCLVVGIILLFVGVTIAPAMAQNTEKQSVSRGNWLYVGGSGPGNYTRIQDAIDDAQDNDTIFVYDDSSPYHEFISINKTINLIGENKNTTIIEGINDVDQYILQINANGVFLRGFTIQNSYAYAIVISSNNTDISGNKLINDAGGILTLHASRNKIHDNIITNGPPYNTAIRVVSGGKNEIFNNAISAVGYGIVLFGDWNIGGSVSNKVYGNSLIQIDHEAIHVINWQSKYNIISRNFISGSDVGIKLSEGDPCFILFNEITNCSQYGIYRGGTDITFIMKNNFINNSCSAYFYSHGILNLWRRNYWDDWNGVVFYTITGVVDDWGPDYHHHSAKEYDWHPSREPYDIPGMS